MQDPYTSPAIHGFAPNYTGAPVEGIASPPRIDGCGATGSAALTGLGRRRGQTTTGKPGRNAEDLQPNCHLAAGPVAPRAARGTQSL